MKRLILPLLLVVALGLLGWLLASNPGQASADWLGWRVDTTAALAAVLALLLALATAAIWTAILWLARAPARRAGIREAARLRQAAQTLTAGWLALAAGDPAEARRLAAQAAGLDPGIAPRLLSAQAAEAQGDAAAAQAGYAALLELPEATPAARAGLARLEAVRTPMIDARPPPAIEATPAADAPLSLGG